MARSSRPYDAFRRSLLRARDERQAALDRGRGAGETLVAASLAVPGPDKAPPGAGLLFARAIAELARAFPRTRRGPATTDPLGPSELWRTPQGSEVVKRRCVAMEEAAPAARLLDLDVYSEEGSPVDRASLYLPARGCLCCGESARDCIRAGRHTHEEIVARALRLLRGG